MATRKVNPLGAFLRANFFAGVFVALPMGITVVSIIWLWNVINEPLAKVFGFTEKIPLNTWRDFWKSAEDQHYGPLVVPLISLGLIITAIFILGMLIRSFLGRALLGFFESLVSRTPLVGLMYTSIKQLAEAFISTDGKAKFQSAVLVQFPIKGCWVIGFLTGSASHPLAMAMSAPLTAEAEARGEPPPDIVTVFVPTTPLPTQGFTLVLPRSETRVLPISVQDAIKLVVSGGIIAKRGAETDLYPSLSSDRK